MSNHLGDTNKMVSETPRTDAATKAAIEHGTGDVWFLAMKLERELNAANERIKRMEEWKESALEVEREWNANAIATMLGGKPGESQRKVIAREVPRLLDRIKRLGKAGNLLRDRYILENENWDLQTVNEWNEAQEVTP